ncbi:MAG: hypothetical protein F6K36_30935, partial [Symploca sp. SIO3C6]|nr:hypothetical protein [Symploca sp. SIO3C6]
MLQPLCFSHGWLRHWLGRSLCVLFAAISVIGLAPSALADEGISNPYPSLPYLKGDATVELMVNDAPITLDIKGKEAPITAGNFVELVNNGFYDGLSFHRVIR